MSSEQTGRGVRRKKRRFYTLIAVLLIGVGIFGLIRWHLRSELDERLDAIRLAGYPVTCAELDQWYSIPNDVENAALVILEAIDQYQKPAKPELVPIAGDADMPERSEALSEEAKTAIVAYIAANKEVLVMLHEASAIEHSRYPVDLGEGINAVTPYLSDIKDAARLLTTEAILHAENNEADSAVGSAASVFGIARSLVDEPVIISQLVRFACMGIGVSAIERTVNRAELDDEQLAELSRVVADSASQTAFSKAFVGERCFGLQFFREPDSVDPTLLRRSRGTGALLTTYNAVGLSDRGATIYLDLLDEFLAANRLPEHERIAAVEAVEGKLDDTSRIHIWLHPLMPAYTRLTQLDLRVIGAMRAVAAGLAVERCRLNTGKLPATLADLVPAYLNSVPKDPFDGKELRYKRLDKGYVVYSIGEDGSDDGGAERVPRSEKNWDVTFTVER